MPGIKVHNDNSPMKGAVQFLNKSVNAYLDDNKTRGIETKFARLSQMMEQDLYLADVRAPSGSNKHREVDLVGFENNGEPVCFTLRIAENLQVTTFAQKSLEKLSERSQEMVRDIEKHLDFETSSSLSLK